MADLLSQYRGMGNGAAELRSLRRNVSHWISQTVAARVLYSTLEEDLQVVVCFLDFQEISDLPKYM